MRKQKITNKLIYALLITFCVLFLVALFLIYLLTDISETFANIIALLSTVIGAFASLIEYQKNEAVNLSNNILNIYSVFIEIPTNKEIQYKLECIKRRDINLFSPRDIEGIRSYLNYFNGVANLIISNDIKISEINTILGYRFFLIMNCPYIQDLEIIPNAQEYRPCIKLHKIWEDWSAKNNFKRSGDVYSLKKRFNDYEKYAN